MSESKAKEPASSNSIADPVEMNVVPKSNGKEENGDDAASQKAIGPYTRAARRLKTFNANGEQVEQEEEFQELKEPPKPKKATALSNASDQRRIQVGKMYQAPNVVMADISLAEKDEDRDVPVWHNKEDVEEGKLDQYIDEAVGVYRLSLDRALFILYNSDYDFEIARAEVRSRKIVEEDWNDDDKILFRLAFQQYGKNFNKIKQIMPYRSVSNIIQHYYQVKKRWKDDSHIQSLETVEIMNTQANNEISRMGKYMDNVETRGCNKRKRFYNAFEPLPCVEQLVENTFEGTCENCGQKSKHIQLTDTQRERYLNGDVEKELHMCLLCRQYLEKRGELRPSDLVSTVKEHIKKQYCTIDDNWKLMLDDFETKCALLEDPNQDLENIEKGKISASNKCLTVVEQEFKELKEKISIKAGISQRLEETLEAQFAKIPEYENIRQRAKDFKVREKAKKGRDTLDSKETYIAIQALARYDLNWDSLLDVLPNRSRDQILDVRLKNIQYIEETRIAFENNEPMDQEMPTLEPQNQPCLNEFNDRDL